jgi:uncharacterized membrane protein
MAELIAIGFEGTHRAAEVLDQLQLLNADWAIDLKDAVAAYRTKDGKLRVDQSVLATRKEGAAWGGLLGGLLGALIAAPFTAGASVAAVAGIVSAGAVTLGATGALIGSEDAASWKDDYGVSEDYVRQVGGMVQPGQSAVFALLRASNPDVVTDKFRGYGGKVLRSTLSPRQKQKLERILAAT